MLVINRSNYNKFLEADASLIISQECQNIHDRGTRQIVALKNTNFDPKHLPRFGSNAKVSRVVHPERRVVILEPRAYHGKFNSGYNVAKATSFADLLLSDAGRKVYGSMLKDRPYWQCVIPFAFVPWKKA